MPIDSIKALYVSTLQVRGDIEVRGDLLYSWICESGWLRMLMSKKVERWKYN